MNTIVNNGGAVRDISLNGWERAMVRGMIRDVKETYPMSKNELAWLEAMNAKFQEETLEFMSPALADKFGTTPIKQSDH